MHNKLHMQLVEFQHFTTRIKCYLSGILGNNNTTFPRRKLNILKFNDNHNQKLVTNNVTG